MNWIPLAEEKQARYEHSFGEDDERSIVRRGNAAYAAGLALLMAGDSGSKLWLQRAAARWRQSWDAGSATDSWGRPIGALKATLLADDAAAVEELARWTLELGAATADSPIGRYAAGLALLSFERWPESRDVAESLREREDFPHDVADCLTFIAADDVVGYVESMESIVDSFEVRDAYLEDVRVADTALVLDKLARRRGIEQPLPASTTLPSPSRLPR